MRRNLWIALCLFTITCMLLTSCSTSQSNSHNQSMKVLVVETFLADIAQNIAGDRLKVDTLLPIGIDPHAYQPTPQDVTRIAESQLLIINGAGFEQWLSKTLDNAGGQRLVVEAAAGLSSRVPGPGEVINPDTAGDPHFWLNPVHVIRYAENIRDGLTAADPAGKTIYTQNAEKYIQQLTELDQWIETQISQIPAEKRLLVTNHESFGYFADRYGFAIIGTIIPSTSSEASPSAKQMAQLIDRIKQYHVKAIFLETGANPQLAEQVAQETGAQVITNMYTHSITDATGDAPSYIDMMKHNVNLLSVLR